MSEPLLLDVPCSDVLTFEGAIRDGRFAGGASVATAATEAMVLLAQTIDATGYRQLYPLVTAGALFAADLPRALVATDALPPRHAALLRLLAFGAPVARAELDPELLRCAEVLQTAGLMVEESGNYRANGWVIAPVLGGVLLTGTPPTYAHGSQVGASAYLGPDSLRFAATLPDATGKRVLDLGTGCGIQGLLAVRGAYEVVLSDIEPRSLELAALNATLNGSEARSRFVLGDGYAPVAEERFDLIVSLPPYVPEVDGSATRTTVAAGVDGLDVVRKVIGGALDHLVRGGELIVRAQLLCDDDGPLLCRELDELAGEADGQLICTDWHPLYPYIVELATSLARHGATASVAELIAAYSTSLRGLGATGVCSALVSLKRRETHREAHRWEILGDASYNLRAAVPSPASGLTIVQQLARTAIVPGQVPVALDPPVAALLDAIDGERDACDLVRAAWGAPAGASPADLRDMARTRVAEFARAGLVELR